jgi:transcriptional regulator with XRE-family HTH domain
LINIFADQARSRRRAMEMSRDQLGREFGVSLKQIQKYESGKNGMSAPRLYDNRLDVSLDSPDARSGLPERSGRCHLGDNRARPMARRINIGDGVFRDPLLLVASIKDGRSVTRSPVGALAVQRRSGKKNSSNFRKLMVCGSKTISIAPHDCGGCDTSHLVLHHPRSPP